MTARAATPDPSEPAPAPVRTLVVDDEALARDLLATLIRRDPELSWVGESCDGARALEDIRRLRPDLVLLDVQMPKVSGLEVLERLLDQEPQPPPHVVLVTAHDEHAIRAFELDALDYLVKPIEKARFGRSMERAKQAVRNRELLALTRRMVTLSRSLEPAAGESAPPDLVIRRGDELISVSPDEIVWVEAANQYSNVHTLRGTFLVAEPLAAYARRLDPGAFVRIHRSALINARRARRILRRSGGAHEVVMDGGARLPLARSKRALVPELLRQVRGGAE